MSDAIDPDLFVPPDLSQEIDELTALGWETREAPSPEALAAFDQRLDRVGKKPAPLLAIRDVEALRRFVEGEVIWRVARSRTLAVRGRRVDFGWARHALKRRDTASSARDAMYFECIAATILGCEWKPAARDAHLYLDRHAVSRGLAGGLFASDDSPSPVQLPHAHGTQYTLGELLQDHAQRVGFTGLRVGEEELPAAGTLSGAQRSDGTLAIELRVRTLDGRFEAATEGGFAMDEKAKSLFQSVYPFDQRQGPTASFVGAGLQVGASELPPIRASIYPVGRAFHLFRADGVAIPVTFGEFTVRGTVEDASRLLGAYFPIDGWHVSADAGRCRCVPFASMATEGQPMPRVPSSYGRALVRELVQRGVLSMKKPGFRQHDMWKLVTLATVPALRRSVLGEWLVHHHAVDDVFVDDEELADAVEASIPAVF